MSQENQYTSISLTKTTPGALPHTETITDAICWFNGYDLPTDQDQALSEAMKRALICYVNGGEPWGKNDAMTFGPDGVVGEVSVEEVGKRRHGEV